MSRFSGGFPVGTRCLHRRVCKQSMKGLNYSERRIKQLKILLGYDLLCEHGVLIGKLPRDYFIARFRL